MNSQKSKTFFSNLKVAVKRINEETCKLKMCSMDFRYNDSEQQAAKNASVFCQELISTCFEVRKEAEKIMREVTPKADVMRDYFYDMEDLYFEIKEAVTEQENYLQNYGYVPMEKDERSIIKEGISENALEPVDSNNASQLFESKEVNPLIVTPKLPTMIESISEYKLMKVKENEIDKTPELDLNPLNQNDQTLKLSDLTSINILDMTPHLTVNKEITEKKRSLKSFSSLLPLKNEPAIDSAFSYKVGQCKNILYIEQPVARKLDFCE